MNINEINLSEYNLCKPQSIIIKKNKNNYTFTDITVEDDNTFFIFNDNTEELILSHNCDGTAINSLLINFFATFWPKLLAEKRIYKVITPLLIARKKNKNKIFYSTDEFNNTKPSELEGYSIEYKKGIAALNNEDSNEMINNPKLKLITLDDAYKTSLEDWFGGDSEKRKPLIINNYK